MFVRLAINFIDSPHFEQITIGDLTIILTIISIDQLFVNYNNYFINIINKQ